MKLTKRVEKLEEKIGIDEINMAEFMEFAESVRVMMRYPPETDLMPLIQGILDKGYRTVHDFAEAVFADIFASQEPGKLWNECSGPEKGNLKGRNLKKNGSEGA